jgi:hypothetical protein
MTNGFQDIQESDTVAPYIVMRMGERMSYACLSRQMQHVSEIVLRKKVVETLSVNQVLFDDVHLRVLAQEMSDAITFQLRIVVSIEVIECSDHIATSG